ncbi:MAG: CotH kinase family protein, partial [Verrucomicrobiota bacterium]|nr:CotH kinase family protein [Verrucomicrobiota bacterium]
MHKLSPLMQTTRFILLVTILLIWPYKSARAENVIISEIMADNEDILQDGHGNYSDWIEIHNPHSINIDLTGFFLTDSRSDLRKWNFPNKTIIGSNEYLIVFASGQEDSSHIDPEGNLHTNFSLKSDGEYLAIIGPDGQEVIQQFSPNYPPTPKNISYGKSGYFLEPSPGNPNEGELVQGFVKDTKFSVDRGIHNEPFDLIISSETEGSRIYYTTDGSVPDPPNGQIYNKPITITNTTVVRAVAYKDNFEPTNVDTHSYIFLDSTLKQPNDGPGLPRSWAGKPADYEMDPEIVNDPNYSNKIVPALRAFPSLSIAIKQDDFYGSKGLYQNPKSQGDGWERSVSVEFIPNNDHEDKFQINSGMRIQGGSSRNPDIPKHSFSLRFRKEYGNAKLKYPLFKDSPFGESAVQEFDYLQLRGGFNFGWTHRHYYQAKHAQYNRDQFANDLYLAMGNTGVHGRWTHLYINGLYWGIYHLHERPDADFMDAYFGAQSKPYDAINSNSATNGTTAAYNKMASLSSNNISSPKKYKELSEHLHVDSLIDYMLLNFYIGNRDWDGHNWRAAGNGPGGEPFRFFPWDSEFALSPNNAGAINSPASLSNALNTDVTNKNGSQRPSGIHQNLKRNAWYRLKFADRIRRHMYNGGPLSPTGAKAIWLRRSEEMDLPIIAESARWGDYRRDVDSGRWNSSQFDLYTRDEHYLKDQKWILNTYFPRRTEVLLSQLRSRGLYPKTEAPDFSQHGGQVPSEFSLEMNNPNAGGTIYYT